MALAARRIAGRRGTAVVFADGDPGFFGVVRTLRAPEFGLEVEVVPSRLRCAPCAHEWSIDVPAFRCPRCAGADVTVLAGEELEVESIEVEQESTPCTA